MRNKTLLFSSVVLCLVILLGSCKKDPDPVIPEYDNTPYALEIGDFPDPDIASDNPLTIQGVELGRMLFYDQRLSKDGSQSCSSCHLQEYGFSDTAQFSLGVENLRGARQAMTSVNLAWNTNEFFWGR